MVGSQIVLALLEAGMGPVRGLYRSPSSLDSARRSWEFQGFGHRWDEVDWHRADLEDPSEVENALEGAHYADSIKECYEQSVRWQWGAIDVGYLMVQVCVFLMCC